VDDRIEIDRQGLNGPRRPRCQPRRSSPPRGVPVVRTPRC
jgi:hypothetical protein